VSSSAISDVSNNGVMKGEIVIRKYPFHFQNINHGLVGYGPTFISEALIGTFALKTGTTQIIGIQWKPIIECQFHLTHKDQTSKELNPCP